MRAILKGADLCASSPEPRRASSRGEATHQTTARHCSCFARCRYARWRDYSTEDSVRFYALRLQEAGMIKASPQKVIAQGTDSRS